MSRLLYAMTLREAQYQYRIDHILNDIGRLEGEKFDHISERQTVIASNRRVVGEVNKTITEMMALNEEGYDADKELSMKEGKNAKQRMKGMQLDP